MDDSLFVKNGTLKGQEHKEGFLFNRKGVYQNS
jgi:hypothetical protein